MARNKFTELIKRGVAAFHCEPNAPETPEQCNICRTYNNVWGFITDTHCSNTSMGLTITGSLFRDETAWTKLLYCYDWKNVTFRSAGYNSLSEFLSNNNLVGLPTVFNHQPAIVLAPADGMDEPAYLGMQCTTDRTQIPKATSQFIPAPYISGEITPETVEEMNKNPRVDGTGWHLYENNLVGCINTENIIIPLRKQ